MEIITRFKRPLAVLAALIALIPPIYMANYLANYAIDFPLWDTWKSADIAIGAREGSLTLEQLYEQPRAYTSSGEIRGVNGQRVFFTNATSAVMGWLFNWPIRGEAYVSLVLTCGTYLLLVDLFRRQISAAWPLALAPFSLLLFSLEDYYNLRWGFQNAYFFAGFFFAAGLWVSIRRVEGWWAPVAAGVLALAATFSTPVGFASWPVFFAVQVAAGRRDRVFIALWAAATLGAVGLYANGYMPTVETGVAIPERLLRLAIAADVVMQPLGLSGWFLIPAAAVVIASIVTLIRARFQLHFVVAWAGLLAYTLAGGVMVSVLRTGWTVRYVTFAMPFWVASAALAIITVVVIGRQAVRGWQMESLRAVNITFVALVMAGIVISDINSYTPATTLPKDDREACYLTYPLTRDYGCISALLPNIALNKWLPAAQTDRLLDKRMSIYADIPPLPIEGYRDGDAIVIDSSDPVDHVWTAYTAQQKNAFHVLPNYERRPVTPPSRFADTIADNTSAASRGRFEKFLGAIPAGETLWYVRRDARQGGDARPFGDTFQALIDQGWTPAGEPATITVRGRTLIVTAYQRK